jgi:hypothetical protein
MSNNNLCYLVKARVGVRGNRKKNILHKGENIHCQDQPVRDNDQNVCFNQGIHY